VYLGLSPTDPAFFCASINGKDIKTIYYYYYHYYLIMFSQKRWLARNPTRNNRKIESTENIRRWLGE
jgi:hypothetical protein